MAELFPVIFEDNNYMVINKPAGLVCHPTKGDEYSSLVGRLRLYLGRSGHLVNRLDRETSGLVMVAKNPETAGELARFWESRAVEKTYLAIVHGHLQSEDGTVEASTGKDTAAVVAIKHCVREDGAPASTQFTVETRFVREEGKFSLLKVRPRTGRKHQIRIHLAHIGHPVVGDKLYGGDEMLYLDFVNGRLTQEQRRRLMLSNQALHALQIDLPTNEGMRSFHAEPEPVFRRFAGMV